MSIFFYEIALKDGTIVNFLSNFDTHKEAYLAYCVSNKTVPLEISAYERWESKTNNKYRRSCAERSCPVDFVIRSLDIEKV
jgi:hypothetical protein